MKIKPITPQELESKFKTSIPDEIFQAVNELLLENYSENHINIKYSEVKERAISLNSSLNESWNSKWLDIEDFYRDNGWGVKEDNPAYCESYDGFWTFISRKS